MSPIETTLGSWYTMVVAEGLSNQTNNLSISSGITESVSKSAVDGGQFIVSKFMNFSRMCLAICFSILSIDIPQKFIADSMKEPPFDTSYTITTKWEKVDLHHRKQ